MTGALALAGHVALVALAFGVQRSAPPPASEGAPDAKALIEIDLPETPPETPPQKTALPEPEPVAIARDVGRGGAGRESLPDLPPPARPEVTAAPVAPPTAAPGATSEFSGPAPAVPMAGDGLAIGPSIWGIPGGLPGGPDVAGSAGSGKPTGPIAPKAAQAPGALVLRDTMLGRDRELGVGNPGATAVANAVADAVRGSSVPTETSAVLVARIGGDGVVVSVGVQQFSSGDVRIWKGVAQAATAALGKKKLGLAGLGPKGAIVQVTVRSASVLPSGAKKAVEGQLPSLLDGPPRDVMPAPSPDGDSCAPERWSDVKPLCGVGMKIGGFDAADMVAGRHRQVKTSFQIKLLDDALALATSPPAAPASAAPAAPAASAAPQAPDAGAP